MFAHFLLGFSLLAAGASELLPCPGLNSIAVDSKYRASTSGAFCLIQNENAGTFNFGPKQPGTRYPVADPSILRMDDAYCVIGTSDDAQNANFIIYRSVDLANWEIFGHVFDERLRRIEPLDGVPGSAQHMMEVSPGRKFCDFWAGQLYQDPAQPERIYITFTAVEGGAARLCHQRDWGYRISWNSVYRASILKSDFLAGGGFADVQGYAYTLNNEPLLPDRSNLKFDGGSAQGRGVPVTATLDLVGPSPGQFFSRAGRACSNTMGCNVAMGIDTGVYFDANDSNRPWVLYSWFDLERGHVFHGSHVAGHRLLPDHFRLDVSPGSTLLPFAFKSNSTSDGRIRVDGKWINNGLMGSAGPTFDHLNQYSQMKNAYGIAEGIGVFFWAGRPYVYFSRNAFDAAAYGIYYRMGSRGAKLSALKLAKWDDEKVREYPLVRAHNRAVPRGVSYGHGDIFLGPGNRPYLIFHKKEPNHYTRTPYFKELTVGSDGKFKALTDDPRAKPDQNLRVFLIPRPTR